MPKRELVDLEYEDIVTETPLAYLFNFDSDKEPVWVPKSQCEVDEESKTVTMSPYLASQKEIEDYAK